VGVAGTTHRERSRRTARFPGFGQSRRDRKPCRVWCSRDQPHASFSGAEARLVITLYVLHSVATHPAGHIWGGACNDTIAFQAALSRVLLGGRDQEFMQYLNSRWKRNASSEAMRLGQARTPSMSDRRLRLSSIRRAMSLKLSSALASAAFKSRQHSYRPSP
jgi:hypothetical protein